MKDYIKIDFKDEDSFVVYYITEKVYENEEDFKNMFKYINKYLEDKYDYSFSGFYNVYIYYNKGIYILEFEYDSPYGNSDFNVTLLLNTVILYEYDDISLIDNQKIYYDDKFYTEIENIINDIRLFEYGRIVYGKEANKVLNKGILFD